MPPVPSNEWRCDLPLHRADEKIKTAKKERAGWYTGGNSTCRHHIRMNHFSEYETQCKAAGLQMSKQAVPANIWAAMHAPKGGKEAKEKVRKQGTLDGMVEKVRKPVPFTPAAILLRVAQHVVCHDQVSLILLCAYPPTTSIIAAHRAQSLSSHP